MAAKTREAGQRKRSATATACAGIGRDDRILKGIVDAVAQPAREWRGALRSGRVRRSSATRRATTASAASTARSGLRAVNRCPPSRTESPPASAIAAARMTSASGHPVKGARRPGSLHHTFRVGFYRRDSTVIANRARAPRRARGRGCSAPNPTMASAPAIGACPSSAKPRSSPTTADVVGMPHHAVGAAARSRRTRRDEDAKRPSLAERRDGPVLQRLGCREEQPAGERARRRSRYPSTHASSTIARKHAGYASCIAR